MKKLYFCINFCFKLEEKCYSKLFKVAFGEQIAGRTQGFE
jgi:hypothetical protein